MPIDKHALFCPVLKACEALEPRWTLPILTEMMWGSARFNEIRRGVPGISPTLLSKRLREMQAHGLVERVENRITGTVDYLRTESSRELEPIIVALGKWAYRNMSADVQLCWMDPKIFMWNMRRSIDVDALPQRRVVICFVFTDQPEAAQNYYVIARPGAPVDVCFIDPGHDVDLFVTTELRTLASVYFGHSRLGDEMNRGRLSLIGCSRLARSMGDWLILSSYARDRASA